MPLLQVVSGFMQLLIGNNKLRVSMTDIAAAALAGFVTACSSVAGPVQILDARATSLIAADAELSVLGEGYAWTEGPLWVSDGGYLLFSDIPNNVIHRYVPGRGVSVYLERSGATGLEDGDSTQGSNGLLLNRAGELVLFQQGDRRVAVMEAGLAAPKAEYRTLAARFGDARLNSPNDGVFRGDGSLYFTDPPYGLAQGFDDPGRELDFSGVFRLAPDGALSAVDKTLTAPNGIALSTNERTLYVAVSDEAKPAWYAYDVRDDGTVANRRLFYDAAAAAARHPGMPDGMAVHSSGTLFATGPGGVWLFSPEGEVLAKIMTGKMTANCTLSADEKTLYMTAHDQLMSIPLK